MQKTLSSGQVTVEVHGKNLLIGLNRPEKFNLITAGMLEDYANALQQLEQDGDLWTGVLFAKGHNFCAGADMTSFSANTFGSGDKFTQGYDVDPYDLLATIRRNKPVVCAVQGIVYTAGLELMLACDMVVAADNCTFSQMEPARAVVAGGGGIFRFVQRAGWGNAMRWLLTAGKFDSAEALRIGIVQEVVPVGQQLDRAIALAEEINKVAPLAVRATRKLARKYLLEGEQACIADSDGTQKTLSHTEDFKEGIQSFFDRRDAEFKGR